MRNKRVSTTHSYNQLSTSKFIIRLCCMAVVGAVLGVIGKLSDVYTEHISNILSGISFWIMLCTAISVYSGSPKRAAAYVFTLCAPMVVLYYLTAELFGLYYSITFAYGWAVFALCTPLLGFTAWHTRRRGVISKLISFGISVLSLFGTYILFGLRIYDILFAIITAIILFRTVKA